MIEVMIPRGVAARLQNGERYGGGAEVKFVPPRAEPDRFETSDHSEMACGRFSPSVVMDRHPNQRCVRCGKPLCEHGE